MEFPLLGQEGRSEGGIGRREKGECASPYLLFSTEKETRSLERRRKVMGQTLRKEEEKRKEKCMLKLAIDLPEWTGPQFVAEKRVEKEGGKK